MNPVKLDFGSFFLLADEDSLSVAEGVYTGGALLDGKNFLVTESGIEPAVPISTLRANSNSIFNTSRSGEPAPWESADFPENPAKIIRALRDHGLPMNRAMLTKQTNIENPGQIFHHPNPRVQAIARAYILQPRRGLYAFNFAATEGAFDLKQSGKNFERTLK